LTAPITYVIVVVELLIVFLGWKLLERAMTKIQFLTGVYILCGISACILLLVQIPSLLTQLAIKLGVLL
jgi:Tfp pilus assembly protein PilN